MFIIKCFEKDKMSKFWPFSKCIGDGSWQFRRILAYRRQFVDVKKSGFADRNLFRLEVTWMKRSSSGFSFFSVCPVSGSLQQTLYARNDWLFVKQFFLWISKWQAISLMLIPASVMPITLQRTSLVGFRDYIYQHLIKFLLLADVFFTVYVWTCLIFIDFFP